MLLLAGSNCSMLLRSIIEINAWFSVVMADSVSFCADTMKAAVEVLYKLKTGDSPANCCRLMLPTGFGSGNAKKKWESGSANLPAGVLPLSKSDESCLILLLVKELNDRLGLQLDPTPNLCREVEVGGAVGRPQILVAGASNAARTADALEKAGADVLRAILPG